MISIFLPCRKGSQRVKKKNIRTFANIEGGLVRIKLDQLTQIKNADEILVSTNDTEVIEIALQIDDSRIKIDQRPEELCSNEATTDDLIKYVPSVVHNEHILWTHVTSPFIDHLIYDDAIHTYLQAMEAETSDSLMSVLALQTFLWDENGPVNYDRKIRKWPFTQTLSKLYEVNSGIFLTKRSTYLECEDRIGQKPYLYELKHLNSFDIDWEEDFVLAEKLFLIKNFKD